MTDIDIDAIRQREQAATKGPWKTGDRFGNRSLGSSVVVLAGNLPPARLDPHRNGRNDAEFIAHARTDVPALLAKVDELTAELANVRAELADARNQAHRRDTDHQQTLRANTELANERDALKAVVEAAKAWVRSSPPDFGRTGDALTDAVDALPTPAEVA